MQLQKVRRDLATKQKQHANIKETAQVQRMYGLAIAFLVIEQTETNINVLRFCTSNARGPASISGEIPHATTKSSYATNKNPAYCNEDLVQPIKYINR